LATVQRIAEDILVKADKKYVKEFRRVREKEIFKEKSTLSEPNDELIAAYRKTGLVAEQAYKV